MVPLVALSITSCSPTSSVNQKAPPSTGKYISTPQFDAAYDFVDGIAAVNSGGKFGYIDKTGEYVITPQFNSANNFTDGLALVQSGTKWGYISHP